MCKERNIMPACSWITKNKNQEVQSAMFELDWNQGTPEDRGVYYG